MSDFILKAEKRTDMGKGASRRLRRLADKLPAVVYGGNEDAQSITLAHNKVFHMLENEAAYASIITLDIEGETEEVLIKDLQRHPYKPKIMHMDLKRVVRGQAMHASVPLHFINEDTAPGAKEGGTVSHQVTAVEITCMPRHLPEFIEVDMGSLNIGDSVHLTDITLPEGVTLDALAQGDDHDLSVATILRPGGAADEEEETEATDEAAAEESTEEEGGEE